MRVDLPTAFVRASGNLGPGGIVVGAEWPDGRWRVVSRSVVAEPATVNMYEVLAVELAMDVLGDGDVRIVSRSNCALSWLCASEPNPRPDVERVRLRAADPRFMLDRPADDVERGRTDRLRAYADDARLLGRLVDIFGVARR